MSKQIGIGYIFLLSVGLAGSAWAATEVAKAPSSLPAVSPASSLSSNTAITPLNPVSSQEPTRLFSTPGISLGQYYDTELGYVASLTLSSYLWDQNAATAIELNGGPRIFRFNMTYGLTLTDHQRIKLTGERLDEKRDFDFDSGTVSQWDGQSAMGVDYNYLLDRPVLESMGFGGYYTHSGNKSLSDVMVSDSVNNLDYLEHRYIAGAKSGNFHVNLASHLWPYSRLSGGIDYDAIYFDTQYTDQDLHGLGGHATLEQRLLPTIKLTLNAAVRQSEHDYRVGLGWLIPSPTGIEMEIVPSADYTHDLATDNHSYGVGLHFNAKLDEGSPHKREYNDLKQGSQQSLLDWTRTPSVRMSDVLAIADGSTVATFLACPTPNAIVSPQSGTRYTASNGWSGNSPQTGEIVFQEARFVQGHLSSGECVYKVDGIINALTLTNPNSGENVGNNWSQGTFRTCTLSADGCHFKDTLF